METKKPAASAAVTLECISESILMQAVRRNAERFPDDFMLQSEKH